MAEWRGGKTLKIFIGQVRMLGSRLDCCQPGDEEEQQLFQKDGKRFEKRRCLVNAPSFAFKKKNNTSQRFEQSETEENTYIYKQVVDMIPLFKGWL